MKLAVVTITIGKEFEALASITHASIKAYAQKINATFLQLNSCSTTPHWEKCLFYDLLNEYDRIIYLDTDIIVRQDTPDLFQLVPYNKIGAFNEAKFTDRNYVLVEVSQAYKVKLENWNGKYYNTGVMVISKCHKKYFKRPLEEYCHFYEQSYLNLQFALEEQTREKGKELMFDLPYIYNRMTCLDVSGEERYASYIIHYAGYHYFTQGTEIFNIISEDLKRWEQDAPLYIYKKRIVVACSGGLGDQIDQEPTVRYMQKLFKEEEIVITTHFPRLFKHLKYNVVAHDDFKPSDYNPFYRLWLFPGPNDGPTYTTVSNLLCHTVDYAAIAGLRRTLTNEDKIIHLTTTQEDEDELDKVLNGFDLSDCVLVHPGRHWESKSFPRSYWQEIVDKISVHVPVCLIGTDDNENRGAYQLDLPSNSINLIDRTSIGTLISVIKRAPVLLSNDSAPVHIAGAFDNHIVLIPTCKHPDHVLPYRKNEEGQVTTQHKTVAMYKKLTLDDCEQRPNAWINGETSAEFIKNDWNEYLPDIDELVNEILTRKGSKVCSSYRRHEYLSFNKD